MKTPQYWIDQADQAGGFDTTDAAEEHIRQIQDDALKAASESARKAWADSENNDHVLIAKITSAIDDLATPSNSVLGQPCKKP